MSIIHPTAIVPSPENIGDDVQIGPYCTIGPNVKIENCVKLHSHVAIDGFTSIGEKTSIYPFASVGFPPQDLKYKGEKSKLIIGKRNEIREHVTINPGTEGGLMETRIGNDCLFMIGSHIAHDCIVGNHVILANNATLGGHVEVGDYAIIGGLSGVHQFVRIGAHAMVGGMSGVEQDLIPYGSAMGERARLRGLNLVGLQRRNFTRDEIHILRTAYRLMFAQEGTLSERIEDVIQLYGNSSEVMEIINFIRAENSRAVLQPKSLNGN